MSFEAHILEPKTQVTRSDVIGLYALPFAANMQNSGDRLQTMVDEAGFPFIVSDLNLQHQKEIFGMPARTANQPSGEVYRAMSLRRAEFVAKEAERYDGALLLGMGDSLAVPAVQGIALHATESFDAVLLRDGWDLADTKSIVGGMMRYVGYTLKDKRQEMKRHKPSSVTYDEWSKSQPTIVDETNILEKMRNVADLMSGTENRDNAIRLAKKAAEVGMAMHVVLLANGLCGTEEQQHRFVNELNEIAPSNTLKTTINDGWHSDLLDPVRASRDIAATLGLAQS